MKRFGLMIVVLLFAASTTHADTLLGHTMRMASRGGIWHDRQRGGGAEVVAKVAPGPGQRLRAMSAWRRSPGHARILRMPGFLRVACVRGYCTGRK